MTQLKTLNASLEVLGSEHEALNDKLYTAQSELDCLSVVPEAYVSEFENSFNEASGEFLGMEASYILKECDPVAYNQELINWVDAFILVEDLGEYKEIEEVIEGLEDDLEKLEANIDDLEEEIEELENEED